MAWPGAAAAADPWVVVAAVATTAMQARATAHVANRRFHRLAIVEHPSVRPSGPNNSTNSGVMPTHSGELAEQSSPVEAGGGRGEGGAGPPPPGPGGPPAGGGGGG